MKPILIDSLTPISISRLLDNDADRVEIDIGAWQNRYPQLKDYRIEVTSPDGIVYMPKDVDMVGNVLIWNITAHDTASAGVGRYQIVATGKDGERKTSANTRMVIRDIMADSASEEPPEPARPWVDQVLDAARRAEDAAERAENAGAGGSGGIAQESDPTVPAWAKQPEKPTYTPEEVGAQPKGDYALKSELPTIPVQSVNGKTGEVKLNAEDVGAASTEEVARLSEEIAEQNKVIEGKQPKGDYALKSDIPVDGEYELIEEFTLNEDLAVNRTQEPDGTAYAFKALRIQFVTNSASTNGSNIYFSFDGSVVWRPVWLDGVSNNTGGSTYVAQIEASKVFGDYVYEKLSYANNFYVRTAQKTPYLGIGDKTITGFSIEAAVTAGTTITIKGVRA